MSVKRPSPQDTISVINTFKNFINNTYTGVLGSPIIDPLSEAGLTRGTGTGLAEFSDEVSISQYPKITFEMVTPGEITKLSYGKSDYREKQTHEFMIMYTCHKSHKWTYPTPSGSPLVVGTPYYGKQQCVRYLQYLRGQIKKYSGSFEGFNEIVTGDISNVGTNDKNLTYTAMMTVKVDTYGGLIE